MTAPMLSAVYEPRGPAEHRAAWEAAAVDRPLSVYPDEGRFGRVRLFGGKKVSEDDLPPAGLVADLPRPDGSLVLESWTAAPFDEMMGAAQSGDLDRARRIAAAIYEWIDMRARADRLLVGAVLGRVVSVQVEAPEPPRRRS